MGDKGNNEAPVGRIGGFGTHFHRNNEQSAANSGGQTVEQDESNNAVKRQIGSQSGPAESQGKKYDPAQIAAEGDPIARKLAEAEARAATGKIAGGGEK